jgi:hypothetical protein
MTSRIFGFFLFISFSIYTSVALPQWPAPNTESCEFYPRLEAAMNCKSRGVNYLSDYAPFYCQEFLKEAPNWSASLNNWTKKTRGCLQEMLYEQRGNPGFTCDNLEEMAFKTHSACYNEADLCQLKIKELWQVFKVIKFKDFFKELRYSDGGMIRLVNFCIKSHIF